MTKKLYTFMTKEIEDNTYNINVIATNATIAHIVAVALLYEDLFDINTITLVSYAEELQDIIDTIAGNLIITDVTEDNKCLDRTIVQE